MNLDLTGRVALVSGSTAGIGFATARSLAECGARVIVNGRTERRVDDACRSIRDDLPNADVIGAPGDLSTSEAVAAIVAAHPDVDVLVNNLGIFEPKGFLDIDDADWRRFFETNVLSGVRLSRAYLPGMLERNWGRMIFVSSESAVSTPAEMVHYGVTKTAQLALSRGLAETSASSGVTVNCVLPGPTNSEGVGALLGHIAAANNVSEADAEVAFFRDYRPNSLIKRFLTVDEVANMIVYLCSPAASGTTGAALRVDGGVLKTIM